MFSRDLAVEFLPLASAAYDVSPTLPGYTVSPIIAKLPTVAQLANRTTCAMFAESPVFGFVARRPGRIVVAFRGTKSALEWVEDAEAVLVPATVGRVHFGFRQVYGQVAMEARKCIAVAYQPGDEVYFLGHSLGGPIAIQAAADCVFPVTACYVYEAPRVGDAAFAVAVNAKFPVWRVTNIYDVVPHLPTRPLYAHPGSAVTVKGKILEPHAHSLEESCLPGLTALPLGYLPVATQ